MTSIPLRSGMRISIKVTSGRCLWKQAIALPPPAGFRDNFHVRLKIDLTARFQNASEDGRPRSLRDFGQGQPFVTSLEKCHRAKKAFSHVSVILGSNSA